MKDSNYCQNNRNLGGSTVVFFFGQGDQIIFQALN